MGSLKTLSWSAVALVVVLGVEAEAASFSGTWIVERKVQGDCLDKRRSFTVIIGSNNTFKAGGRMVTISPSGDFTFTSDRVEGHPTVYVGKLSYKSGNGTFKNAKGCIGTFTMQKK